MLIAYTKNANVAEIVESDLPDDPSLERRLARYFPPPLRERFADEIPAHRLRREIITTQLVNQMVNLSGISFDHRMTEETGASSPRSTRAWVDGARHARLRRAVGRDRGARRRRRPRHPARPVPRLPAHGRAGALWVLRHRRPPFDIAAAVGEYRPGIPSSPPTLRRDPRADGDVVQSAEAARLAAGVPEAWPSGRRVAAAAHRRSTSSSSANRTSSRSPTCAAVYWQVFDRLELMWLWDGVGTLPRADRWQTQARSALRDDMLSALADLTDGDALRRRARSTSGWRPTSAPSPGRRRCSPRSAEPRRTTSPTCRSRCASCATSR